MSHICFRRISLDEVEVLIEEEKQTRVYSINDDAFSQLVEDVATVLISGPYSDARPTEAEALMDFKETR